MHPRGHHAHLHMHTFTCTQHLTFSCLSYDSFVCLCTMARMSVSASSSPLRSPSFRCSPSISPCLWLSTNSPTTAPCPPAGVVHTPYAPHRAMPYEEKLALDNVPVKYSTESMYAVWPTGSFADDSAWDARNSKIQLRFYRRFVRFERGWDNKERMVAACVILVCLFCPCPCPCRSLGRRWCAHCVMSVSTYW